MFSDNLKSKHSCRIVHFLAFLSFEVVFFNLNKTESFFLHASYFDTQNVKVFSLDGVNHMYIQRLVFEQSRFKVLRLKMGHHHYKFEYEVAK